MNNSNDLKNLTISSDKTMSDAMHKLNENIRGICFITNNNVLVGLITDGDIRRALLNDFTKESLIESFMNKNFVSLSSSAPSEEIKKKLSNKISNKKIDDLYDEAINHGAIGGKLLGAGNGGFILFYVEKNKRKKFLKKFNKLLHVPFRFDFTGSQIIHYSYNN